MLTEKTISSKEIHKGRIISLYEDEVELPQGRGRAKREIIRHAGAVAVVALTKDKKMVFVRQYRKPVEEALLEIPAGIPNKGETPEQSAIRELREETGYIAAKTQVLLTSYVSPGYADEKMVFVLAEALKLGEKDTDEDEITEVELVKFSSPMEMIKKLKIKDNKTIIGLYLAGAAMCP